MSDWRAIASTASGPRGAAAFDVGGHHETHRLHQHLTDRRRQHHHTLNPSPDVVSGRRHPVCMTITAPRDGK